MAFLATGELTDEIIGRICLCRGQFEGCRVVMMVEIPPWNGAVTSLVLSSNYSSKLQQWLYSSGVKE